MILRIQSVPVSPNTPNLPSSLPLFPFPFLFFLMFVLIRPVGPTFFLFLFSVGM